VDTILSNCTGLNRSLSILVAFNRDIDTKGLLFYHKLGFSPIKGEPRTDQNGLPAYLIYLNRKN
jgi:hypothetical protein